MSEMPTRRRSRWIVAGSVAALALASSLVAASFATDRPGFCDECHEMAPYERAWAEGPHSEVWCIECHVDAGPIARLEHKPAALAEVAAHVQGDVGFPLAVPATVPDGRCLRCHPEQGPEDPPQGFSHDAHRTYAACQQCHTTTGHDVADAALKNAGVLDPASAAARAKASIPTTAVAAPRAGRANLAGHVDVLCSRCHDMEATGCPACHAPQMADGHPADEDCSKCHPPGEGWAFAHPSRSGTCPDCHEPPPAGDHPAGNDCTSCHKPGDSWAFVHPERADCTACHDAPENHYGPACASCHRPTTSFKDATFDHPGFVGEHDYRSIPCRECHPSGPPQVSCTCHGGGYFHGD